MCLRHGVSRGMLWGASDGVPQLCGVRGVQGVIEAAREHLSTHWSSLRSPTSPLTAEPDYDQILQAGPLLSPQRESRRWYSPASASSQPAAEGGAEAASMESGAPEAAAFEDLLELPEAKPEAAGQLPQPPGVSTIDVAEVAPAPDHIPLAVPATSPVPVPSSPASRTRCSVCAVQ